MFENKDFRRKMIFKLTPQHLFKALVFAMSALVMSLEWIDVARGVLTIDEMGLSWMMSIDHRKFI